MEDKTSSACITRMVYRKNDVTPKSVSGKERSVTLLQTDQLTRQQEGVTIARTRTM